MRRMLRFLGLFAAAAAAHAQRYSRGHAWWEAGQGGYLTQSDTFDNAEGQLTLVNREGAVQTKDHPFFEAIGVNGRACVTCHQPADAMSVSTATLRERWIETGGRDPVFAAVDGSDCPDLPQESAASHSLLLKRGLFRIALPWPPQHKPDFRIEVVHDPTGCNHNPSSISVYRRPRIPANLDQIAVGPHGRSFMVDGREPTLESQATTAILVHEQATVRPTPQQLERIVAFESQLYVAQSADVRAGLLTEKGGPAMLGPENLAAGVAGLTRRAAGEMPRFFDVWRMPDGAGDSNSQLAFRASVARGSAVFFLYEFPTRHGKVTCAGCHASGITRWMDIGTTNTASPKDAPDLPMFRVTCEASGRVIYTHDPGRGLISGKCADVGAMVLGPIRGLAARAPYFSNGSAPTLWDVVEFYDSRFGLWMTQQMKQDLVNFLRVL